MLIQWRSCSWCLDSSTHGMHPYHHNSLLLGFTWSWRLDCRMCRIWSFHFLSIGSLSIARRSAWLTGRRVCWTKQLLLRNRLSELYRVIRVRLTLPRHFLEASSGNAAPFFNFRTFSLNKITPKCLFSIRKLLPQKKMLCYPNNFYLIFYFFRSTLDLFLSVLFLPLPPQQVSSSSSPRNPIV